MSADAPRSVAPEQATKAIPKGAESPLILARDIVAPSAAYIRQRAVMMNLGSSRLSAATPPGVCSRLFSRISMFCLLSLHKIRLL